MLSRGPKPGHLQKEEKKKNRSEIYADTDVFAEKINSGLNIWCKAGFS